MEFDTKYFIFEVLLHVHPTQRCNNYQRHLERPSIGDHLLRRNLGWLFLEGLFICSWLQIKNVHISGVRLHNTLKRVLPDKGIGKQSLLVRDITTNKTEFPLTCILRDRSETISDRQPKLKDNYKSQTLTLGGEGLRLVFVSLRSSISFSPAYCLT